MKIKWKIIVVTISIIIVLTSSIILNTYIEVKKLVQSDSGAEIKNYSNMGLQLLEKTYPGVWSVQNGKLYKGEAVLNENYETVDQFTAGTEVLATIFLGDTRIATNVRNDKGERQINTKASDIVIKKVLEEKEVYSGMADIQGKSALTYYVPLKDADGAVVGIWFVGLYMDLVNNKISNTVLLIALLSSGILLISIVVSFILGRGIAKGIGKVKDRLRFMENGSFYFDMEDSILKRKDEVGEIANSSRNLQLKMTEIIKGIQGEAEHVKIKVSQSEQSMEAVSINIENISATTQQLSAGMQETSAAAEEMSASTYEIETKVSNMKEKTEHGDNLAKEIKARAEKLKEETGNSYQRASEIYVHTNKQLRESIQKAGAIEEIKELSQTIISITAQTNLLALNASIEAARAGEAGKGFSIVAEQIRELSDNSKQAVSRINDITANVSLAVESVIEDSNNLLHFVDHQVLKDYEMLVSTSNQYAQDADTVRTIISEVNDVAEKLYETMQEIRSAIDEITTATGEGAMGTTDIAEKINDIVQKVNDALKQVQENRISAEQLKQLTGFFQLQ